MTAPQAAHPPTPPRPPRRTALGLPLPDPEDFAAQLAALPETPGPHFPPAGLGPVELRREIPVTVLAHADGTTETVNHETDEACYSCRCCALWGHVVNQLHEAMRRHYAEAGHEDGPPRDHTTGQVSCLVCAMLDGQASTGVADG